MKIGCLSGFLQYILNIFYNLRIYLYCLVGTTSDSDAALTRATILGSPSLSVESSQTAAKFAALTLCIFYFEIPILNIIK
jgi:hypothetical protein